MEIVVNAVALALGFTFLWKGGTLLVDGASKIAIWLSVSPFLVGLTVVAFGTSLPELSVNVISSWQNRPDIVFGNVFGSNLSNLLLILGVSSLIFPITVSNQMRRFEIPVSILSGALVWATCFIGYPDTPTATWISGIILLTAFAAFLTGSYLFNLIPKDIVNVTQSFSRTKATFEVILGLILLPLGAKLTLTSAVVIATHLNLSEAFISLFAIALGTSLPELAASIAAAFRQQSGLILGNIIGSNIFNNLLVIGVSALVRPLTYNPIFNTELILFAGVTSLLIILSTWPKPNQFARIPGTLFLAGYFCYISFILTRG